MKKWIFPAVLFLLLFSPMVSQDIQFPKVQGWVNDIWENSTYPEKIPIVLLGNKVDLKDKIVLTTEDGDKVAKELTTKRGDNVPHFETSARTGVCVDEAFEALGRLIIKFTETLPEE